MTSNTAKLPNELMTVSEAARRIGVCANTLRRRLEREKVSLDSYMLEGTHNNLSPLFDATRIEEFRKLIQKP